MTSARPSRKQARRDALFLLYQTEVTDLEMKDLVEGQRLREGYGPDEFTVSAVSGVLATEADLDTVLGAYSTSWSIDRIAPLERSIMRLALWEIESESTPPEVAIDEAVRLAKRYSTDEAGALVNGILGAVVRDREADAVEIEPDAGELEPDADGGEVEADV